VLTVKSLTVTPIGRAAQVARGRPVGPIEVSVPIAPPASRKQAAAATPSRFDPNAVERPEFQFKAKPLVKSATSVTGMMVRVAEDGRASGFTSDIIATVPSKSRDSDSAGIGFFRADGDEAMKTAFEEAVRAVTLRYPYWEPGRIDVSFGEKFTAHGGPSSPCRKTRRPRRCRPTARSTSCR
jgi:hypothetical protein